MGSQGVCPWDLTKGLHGLPMGSQGGCPWDPRGEPLGSPALGDTLALWGLFTLGDLSPWGSMWSLGDQGPWGPMGPWGLGPWGPNFLIVWWGVPGSATDQKPPNS